MQLDIWHNGSRLCIKPLERLHGLLAPAVNEAAIIPPSLLWMYCLSWSWRKTHGESTDDTCPTCSWCFGRVGMWPKLDGFPLRFTIIKKTWVGCDLRPRHIGTIPSTAFTYTALVDVRDLQVCRESLQPWQKLRECNRSFLWGNLLSNWTYSWNTQCISMSCI